MAVTDTLDPNDVNSVGTVANQAIGSSAPPYEPIVSQNNLTPAVKDMLATQASNPSYSAFGLNTQEHFTSNPIVSKPEDNLNYTPLAKQQFDPIAQATATSAALPTKTEAQTYAPSQGVSVEGSVDPNSLVQNQLTKVLNSNTNANGVPDWAQPAATAANQRSNALGLGASTMAANAEAEAILKTALPIAEQNANTYALMRTQNVTDEQQTMLSNTAMRNAAYQFNASSVNQNNQFFASLTNATVLANAAQATAVSQFNAGQTNAVQNFRDNLTNTRDEFNASNQLVVDQSNVKWQRSINTANTAADNAANQANVKNYFNVQQSALNDLWQQARDEASWALTSSENSQNRALSLVNSSLNRQTSYGILASQLSASMYSQLGQFGVSLLGGPSGISSGIKSLFGGSSSGSGGSLSSSEVSNLVNAGGYSNQGGVSFGGGSDSFAAEGGIITKQNPNENGIDLTSDTPHLSNDKISFGKY